MSGHARILPLLMAAIAFGPAAAAQTLTQEDKKQAIFSRLYELSPRTAPPAAQLSAPSTSSDAPSLADAPSFTELIGMAFGNNLVSGGKGSLTISLNVFAFKALADPGILDRQSDYARYGWLRRLGGSVTLGGKGESFDRDGDGKSDPALEVQSLDDIVTWEARWRALGSRDRRDGANSRKFADRAGAAQDAFDKVFMGFLLKRGPEITAILEKAAFDDFLHRDDVEADLRTLSSLDAEVRSALSEVVNAVDRSMVWTLVFTGVRRSDDKFGPDRLGLGLRGVGDLLGWSHTLNADYAAVEGLGGEPDGEVWKLGYEASRLLWRTRLSQEKVTLAFAAAVERYRNIPQAKHDTIAKAQVKVDLPVKKGVSVPLSVTWANHADLLTDQKLIRGNFGIALDFSQLK